MKLKPAQELQALELLRQLPLFSGVAPEALAAVAQALDFRDLPKGKVVLMDQEIGRTLFLMATGSVSVWKRIGQEKRQLATLTAPNFVGERSMFEESPASALVKTEAPCVVFALERDLFDPIAAKFPGVREAIHKNMEEIRRLRLTPAPAKPSEE